jgi:DNA gyrase subunit A
MEDDKEEYLLFVTKQGTVKRTQLCEFASKRKGGKRALTLDEGDELIYVRHTTGSDHVIIATKGGLACRFDETDARVMGRSARGVRGIRLNEGDYVTGVALVDEGKQLVTITENGFGKRSEFDEFACHNRGGKGVCCHNVNEKTGLLAGIAAVSEDEDLMLISDDGNVIRVPVSDVPIYSRSAGGVIVMRMAEGTNVVNFAVVESDKDEEEATENEEVQLTDITEEV